MGLGTQKQRRRPNGGRESALMDPNTYPCYWRGRGERGEKGGACWRAGKGGVGGVRVGGRSTTIEAVWRRETVGE